MLTSFLAIFTASVVGSLHCAGMCGAFCAVATTTPLTIDGRSAAGSGAAAAAAPVFSLGHLRTAVVLSSAYNLGRLATYTTLGAIAGAIGHAVDLGASAVGLQRGAAYGAGAFMLAIGIVGIARGLGIRLPSVPVPADVSRLAARGHRWASQHGPVTRAALIGLLTTLLPCGFLYAFLVTAAGTSHPLSGALAMLAFWLGTLPVMTSLGVGVQSVLAPVRRYIPVITAVALVALGLLTLSGRMAFIPADAAGAEKHRAGDCPLCH